MNNGNKEDVEILFEEFLDFKEIQNLSDQTIIFYKNNTKRFFKFLTQNNIKIGVLDLKGGYVKLTTMKNRRQQIVPLLKTMVTILKGYLKYRDEVPEEYLFCTEYGDKFSRYGLYSAIKKYNINRGVDKTSLHLYRNVFAQNL